MPNWKFLVASHYAGTQQRRLVCESIKNQVELLGLSTVLPLVKFETGSYREYYLGIAYDDNISNSLDNARQVLLDNRITKIFSEPQDPEAITKFLRGNVDCASFTIPLTYEMESQPEAVSSNHLLSWPDIRELQPVEMDTSDNICLDKLLYWCSSTGTGDLGRLQNACRLLGASIEWSGTWSIMRRLVLLGHLEFDMRNSVRWGVVPPVLVRTSLKDSCFLSGQRSPSLMQALSEKFRVIENPQIGGPRQLIVEGINDDAYVMLKSSHQIANLGCVSLQLSKRLPTIEQWAKGIPAWDEKDFGRYQIEQYVSESDEFHKIGTSTQFRKGLYRFSLENNSRKVETLAYFDEKDSSWVCGDFYGLRFLARYDHEICKAIYLDEERKILIPITDRWPMPYERALVLASGALPLRLQAESGLSVLAYSSVSRELATQLSCLLGLKIEAE